MSRSVWSVRRALVLALVAVVWAGTGLGVYLFLGAQRGGAADQARRPGEGARNPALERLPGTLYVVQDGTLYRLVRGSFTPVLKPPSASAGWQQPSFAPSGRDLVVVRRDYAYSDLYLVDLAGHVESQLTHNASGVVERNHWAFYPRFSSDGANLFYSYDPKDRFSGYNVVLAVWSMSPGGGGAAQARQWTTPRDYSGGDIQPVPLPGGRLIYTRYAFEQNAGRILSQLWLTPGPGAAGTPLTQAQEDCSQPSLSPDGRRVVMICTSGTQLASVKVAAFDGAALGQRQALVTGRLAAQPTWAPDGVSVVYLAPDGISGHFQLWQQRLPAATAEQQGAVSATPPAPPRSAAGSSPAASLPSSTPPTPTPLTQPVRLTSDLDLDATSTIAWHA